MDYQQRLKFLFQADLNRWNLLDLVGALELPDCWVGAGFVRDAVWDHLHDRPPSAPSGDVDVLYFDPDRLDPVIDQRMEWVLREWAPQIKWSVKNQARMHLRNGDAPYTSTADAMCYWPETATAVAVRRTASKRCDVLAPLGLEDLFEMIVRPTLHFATYKREIFEERVSNKGWLKRWPRLRCVDNA